MAATGDYLYPSRPHPVHGVLLAGTVPLFLGTLLTDITYWNTYQVQWSNFASWLNAGGLVFTGLALVSALIALIASRTRGSGIHVLMLLATWILGFLNALVHARDAWAMMPGALVLSLVVFVLALASTVLGFAGYRQREAT